MVWCNILTDFVVILANTLDNYNCPSSVYFFINVNCNSCNFVVVSAIIKKQFICVLQNIFRLSITFCYYYFFVILNALKLHKMIESAF